MPGDQLDRLAVAEVVTTTVFLSELGEWRRYGENYTDTVVLDYSPSIGESEMRFERSELVAFSRAMLSVFDATQHQVTNVIVDLDGDQAVARSQMRASHRIGEDVWVRGGVYIHRLERNASGWKIWSQTRVALYEEGSRVVARRASEQGAALLEARDRHAVKDQDPGDGTRQHMNQEN